MNVAALMFFIFGWLIVLDNYIILILVGNVAFEELMLGSIHVSARAYIAGVIFDLSFL